MASEEFTTMFADAGVFRREAIEEHRRIVEADEWIIHKALPDGDTIVYFFKDDEERPVARACVTQAGRVEPYVTEVIA
jgi:putative SOS response-associated peptidase YedK